MDANRSLAEFASSGRSLPDSQVTDPKLGGSASPTEYGSDIVESPDRCGMDSTHSVQSVVLVLPNGDEVGIYQVWIVRRPTFIETLGITFRFENDDGVFEVLITGFGTPASTEGLRKIHRKLCWGKQALLRTSENVVKDIAISMMKEEKEEEE